MRAVQNGAGREESHATIKRLANLSRTQGTDISKSFFELVLQEESLKVSSEDLAQMTSKAGMADVISTQVEELVQRVVNKVGLSDSLQAYVPGNSI